MPDKRNNTPMAIVIQVTVFPGYFISIIPMAIEHIARKTELCNIFILLYFLIYGAKIRKNDK